MTPFKPSVYSRHTATLIDNKLYILGGYDLNNNRIKEFFYLDISVQFNTQELSWQDLSNINMVPPHSSATSVKGGPNNDTLILYGGISSDQTMASVYTFNSQSIIWSIPKIAGVNTFIKWGSTGIINNDGRMYLWSGSTDTGYVINEMFILDTINLSWSKGSIINAPTPRFGYSATLLPNNKIIYMGKRVIFIFKYVLLFLLMNAYCLGGDNDVTTTYNISTLNISKGTALTLSEVYFVNI
ncbi:hypothetical protein RhiirA4_482575 [Rhizophagus irregularis]|uniref:Galactose oxidase n=1 Tax=Rhizophagus irregularis TaxID=588596 RepID=A0A2I1HLC7_9GLOM|nr:hypothetical protein RhiirA4_482575 [Rhizophagus irregularis]